MQAERPNQLQIYSINSNHLRLDANVMQVAYTRVFLGMLALENTCAAITDAGECHFTASHASMRLGIGTKAARRSLVNLVFPKSE
jgi:hypothetical protein